MTESEFTETVRALLTRVVGADSVDALAIEERHGERALCYWRGHIDGVRREIAEPLINPLTEQYAKHCARRLLLWHRSADNIWPKR